MSQPLPFDEIKFETSVSLEEIINTPDDSDIRYFLEVDLGNSYNIRQQTKKFPFAPENKIISKNDFDEYMNKIKPKNYT